jgi:uncharacterized repeat protein (TIGR01451 family)
MALTNVSTASTDSLAQDEAADGVRLLSANDTGLDFTVRLPAGQLRMDPILVNEQEFVQPFVSGWANTGEPGAPALPYALTTIAAPVGVTIRLHVEPGQARTVSLPAEVAPGATLEADWQWDTLAQGQLALPNPVRELLPDETIYASAAPYPGTLAEVASDGLLRQQRVVGIATYPVQYEPAAGTLRVYDSLVVRVAFEPGPQAGALASGRQPESAVYEGLLQAELLNYGSAREWTAAAPAVPTTAPWVPPSPGYRVYVREAGIYKLAYGDLDLAGLPVDTLDPRTLRLYAGGQEVAIHVKGEADGSLDGGAPDQEDYLLFFGEGAHSKYTSDSVYWLTYGSGPGLRMGARDGTPSAGTTPSMHERRLQVEKNTFYIPRLAGDERLDRYIWDYVYPPSKPTSDLAFSLPAPSTETYTGTLKVSMFGYISSAVDPDHHIELYLNGQRIGEAWWDGIAWHEASAEFNQSLLKVGANTVHVLAPNDTGVGKDLAYVDWAEIEYADTFTARSDKLDFTYTIPGSWDYKVDGFTNADLVAFDLSDPAAVVRVEGGQVDASASGFSLSFDDTVVGPTAYFALATSAYLTPPRIELDSSSNLKSAANGADYIIVTHSAFSEAVTPLAAYRASQGLRVAQVDVQDVYDEFAYGHVDAQAIHDFLAHAYHNWQRPAPSYVLLVGDGHYDPKDYQGYGRTSYIPPYLAPVDPWIGETAADNIYVSLTGKDSFPDMMLGRLAVNSAAEAAIVVGKTLAYEQNPVPGDWNRELLFVADNKDTGGDFAKMSKGVIDCCLPDPYGAKEVYYKLTHATPADVRASIISEIGAGKLFVNYIGHAGAVAWAHEGFFATKDFSALADGDKLPIMLPMTCYDGYYQYPFSTSDSMAESIVRIGGKGAVASWAPTGLGVATGHDELNRGFFEAVFRDGTRILGAATMTGKLRLAASGSNLDLLDTYLLFGDPALHINALDADLQVEKAVEPAGIVEQGDVLTYTLTFSNAGPAMAHSVVLSDVVPATLLNPTVVYSSTNVLGRRPGAPLAWDIADLGAGEGGEIRFTSTVGPGSQPGPYTIRNCAEVSMAEPDTNPSTNTSCASTTVSPPGSAWRLYLPAVARSYDPLLYDDFEDTAYDNAYDPSLWARAGHPAYDIRQRAGALVFDGSTVPGGSGVDLYLIKPRQRSLREVQQFEAKLKFDSSGQVGGYASVKIQITSDGGGGQGWWTQCTLATQDARRPALACDVSTYNSAGRTTEYISRVVPASFDIWHTVRILADPDTAQLRFYLDGALIGTHMPRDAAALRAATNLVPKVGVWDGAAGTNAMRRVDQVRITQALR